MDERELGQVLEAADAQAKLQALFELRNEVMARLQTAGEIFEQQVGEKRQRLLAQTREEVKRLVEEEAGRAEKRLCQCAAQLNSEMARQSEKLLARLQARLDAQFARHQTELRQQTTRLNLVLWRQKNL